jgi:squalene-hopene/tetraprenyl-beta-curcumene cyclase
MNADRTALADSLDAVVERLLAARDASGAWPGRLSSSALSTATAAIALALTDADRHAEAISAALDWLADHVNADGGWGDTLLSRSNLPTTLLAWSAFAAGGDPDRHVRTIGRARLYVQAAAGGTEPLLIARAVAALYGADRTFSVPILTACALAGRLGAGREAFRHVPQLPMELGILPHAWLRRVGLPVVSYALPALIAIGLVRHRRRPRPSPGWLVRQAATPAALRRLEAIQPADGGFLEAAPLTSFVAMSLAGAGLGEHPVARRCVDFLLRTVRSDGSWPIDTNLATWLTSLSVASLDAAGRLDRLCDEDRRRTRDWLLAQQYRTTHPYTGAAPGGWAWTDLPGGVPDADDTAGALLAIRRLGPVDEPARAAAASGVGWLMALQNRDGGVPTFCRGWGRLPFDRSSPDITAHALAALTAWRADVPPDLAARCGAAAAAMIAYLRTAQRTDGSWVPLWFGNEAAPEQANPVYGTARVLLAVAGLEQADEVETMIARGATWLASAAGEDGGWGGAPGAPPSIEETALAVEALTAVGADPSGGTAVGRGVAWLADRLHAAGPVFATPIGL